MTCSQEKSASYFDLVEEAARLDVAMAAYNKAVYRWRQTDRGSRDEPMSLYAMRAAVEALGDARQLIPTVSDQAVREWADRHDFGSIGLVDARAAFEDAQSAHMLATAARPESKA